MASPPGFNPSAMFAALLEQGAIRQLQDPARIQKEVIPQALAQAGYSADDIARFMNYMGMGVGTGVAWTGRVLWAQRVVPSAIPQSAPPAGPLRAAVAETISVLDEIIQTLADAPLFPKEVYSFMAARRLLMRGAASLSSAQAQLVRNNLSHLLIMPEGVALPSARQEALNAVRVAMDRLVRSNISTTWGHIADDTVLMRLFLAREIGSLQAKPQCWQEEKQLLEEMRELSSILVNRDEINARRDRLEELVHELMNYYALASPRDKNRSFFYQALLFTLLSLDWSTKNGGKSRGQPARRFSLVPTLPEEPLSAADDPVFRLRGLIDAQGDTLSWVALALEKLSAAGDPIRGVFSQLIEDAGMTSPEQWVALLDWLRPEPAVKLAGILKPESVALFVQLVKVAAGFGPLRFEGRIELAQMRRVGGGSGTPPLVALWQALHDLLEKAAGSLDIPPEEMARLTTALIKGKKLEPGGYDVLKGLAEKWGGQNPVLGALFYLAQMDIADQWAPPGLTIPPDVSVVTTEIKLHLKRLPSQARKDNLRAIGVALRTVWREMFPVQKNVFAQLPLKPENAPASEWVRLASMLDGEGRMTKALAGVIGNPEIFQQLVMALAGRPHGYRGEPILLTREGLVSLALHDYSPVISGVLRGLSDSQSLEIDGRARNGFAAMARDPDDASIGPWVLFATILARADVQSWLQDEKRRLTPASAQALLELARARARKPNQYSGQPIVMDQPSPYSDKSTPRHTKGSGYGPAPAPRPPAATRHAEAYLMPAAVLRDEGTGGAELAEDGGSAGKRPAKRSFGSFGAHPGRLFGFAPGCGAWNGRGVFRTPGRFLTGR